MKVKQELFLNLLLSFLFFPVCYCDGQPTMLNPDIFTPSKAIGDCMACKLFIDSFQKGLKRTERGKFEGGDTAWEEEKFKVSYRRSEVRLIDIQEGLCEDVNKKHSGQCHHMAEKAEDLIEEWWSQDPEEAVDLYSHICIEKFEVCCPKLHYGKNCSPCLGDHANMCSGNGKCRGDGTRKGNGTCLCDAGYAGDQCNRCDNVYYESYKDKTKLLCSHCHRSCAGNCRGGSQKDCENCRAGYTFHKDLGCEDIVECDDPHTCNDNEFCVNSLGSYACILCDKSCEGCYGDGVDLCKKCAKGYSRKNDICVMEGADDIDKLSANRYLATIGLLIAAGIIIPTSTRIGQLIGILVLTYIIAAEYHCVINEYDEGLLGFLPKLLNFIRI